MRLWDYATYSGSAIVPIFMFIVNSWIKLTVQPSFRTMQRTTHEKSIDLYFGINPTALLLFSTPSNLHCPALAQSLWVIFTFSPKISPNLFEASPYLSLVEWEACLFSILSAVYTSAEGHFFANACFSGRLFVKCIMTCAYPQAESLRWNEVG